MNLFNSHSAPRRRRDYPGYRPQVEGLESRALLSGNPLGGMSSSAVIIHESPLHEEDIRNGGFASSTVNVLRADGAVDAGTSPLDEEDVRNGGFGSSTVNPWGGAGEKWIEAPVNRGVAVGNPGSADSFFDVFTELAGRSGANGFFDVFTELTDESGRDSFFDVFTELAGSSDADTFFDVFTEFAQKVRMDSVDVDATPNQLDEVTFTIAPTANNDSATHAISRGDGQGQTLMHGDAAGDSDPKLEEIRMRGFAIADLGIAGDWNGDGYTQIGHGG